MRLDGDVLRSASKQEDGMDKARHPHVIRTWTVERTKVLHRQPQRIKMPNNPQPFRGPASLTHSPKPEAGR
jgi:hypothetical protein